MGFNTAHGFEELEDQVASVGVVLRLVEVVDALEDEDGRGVSLQVVPLRSNKEAEGWRLGYREAICSERLKRTRQASHDGSRQGSRSPKRRIVWGSKRGQDRTGQDRRAICVSPSLRLLIGQHGHRSSFEEADGQDYQDQLLRDGGIAWERSRERRGSRSRIGAEKGRRRGRAAGSGKEGRKGERESETEEKDIFSLEHPGVGKV